jgi:uncharacterized protein (TIGR03435 family)
MKINASRVVIRSWTLADMIGAAYRVRVDQIAGPDWIGTPRFDVQATVPDGASSDQVPEMLQVLLAERFKMVARRGEKVMAVYTLVAGKGRLKLQESAPGDSTPPGCTVVSGGHRACHRMSMADLANMLTQLNRMYNAMPPGAMTWGIDLPTVDLTGLSGVYDFTMDFGPESTENGGSVMDAVEKLGLKLEAQKRPYEVIFIDRLEKVPTEN